ncbi:MAG: rhomboid family intramembrane serine protease [Acidobacteriota bacterium]|nr:rhomboid family intramembrane serine protease [Acidobacteriota bacterium]
MPRGRSMSLSFPPFTPAVKQLLIANGAVFLLFTLLGAFGATSFFADWMYVHLGLEGYAVVHGEIWQLVTYAFLHAGLMHILFNLLALWMFGAQLEMDWGYSLFMQFYFFCVIGAALVTVAVSFTGLLGVSPHTLTVGASGGIYGLLLAFGILHGESEIMLFPLPFLIKAKYFVMGIIALALYGALASSHGGGQSIAYMAHLGGALFGYIWLKFVPRRGFGFLASERAFGLRNSYYRWKRKRAARKFEVYMRKHDRGDYRHDDYFDEHGNFRDPSTRDKKDGDSRGPWVN